MKILSSLFLGLVLLASSSFALSIEAKDFMLQIKGVYQIEAVNGDAPHSGNRAEIDIEEPGTAEWAMPYCAGKICLPGFLSFPFGETVISERLYSSEEKVYSIKYKTQEYFWIEKGDYVYFRNPQFNLPNGKIIALEYRLKRY